MVDSKGKSVYERLSHPSSMMDAEMELLVTGVDALPVLESIFSGDAKNLFGMPYKEFGLARQCALEIAVRMGSSAKLLEVYIRDEVLRGVQPAAARAMRGFAPLEDASVIALAKNVGRSGSLDVSLESALTLVRLGYADHPAVLRQLSELPSAQSAWEWALSSTSRSRS